VAKFDYKFVLCTEISAHVMHHPLHNTLAMT